LLTGQAPPDIARACIDKVAECIDRLNGSGYIPDGKRLTPPVVLFDLRGRTAGQAILYTGGKIVIRLNLELLLHPKHKEDILLKTIPHEVAHCAEFQVFGKAGHGAWWRHFMVQLGINNPSPRHDYEVTPARKTIKYKYRCDCRIYWIGKSRHNKIITGERRFSCRNCGGLLTYMGETSES
jgi:SprT protein